MISQTERTYRFLSTFDPDALGPSEEDLLFKSLYGIEPTPPNGEIKIASLKFSDSLFSSSDLFVIITPPYLYVSFETRLGLIGLQGGEKELDETKKYKPLQPGILMGIITTATGSRYIHLENRPNDLGTFRLSGSSFPIEMDFNFIGSLRYVRGSYYRYVSSIFISSSFFPFDKDVDKEIVKAILKNYRDGIRIVQPHIDRYIGEKYGVRQTLPTSSA